VLESTSQYIAYVMYRTADGRLEREALTGRLVRDEPEDVTFYATEDAPLGQVLAERLSSPVAGDSRIGSIRARYCARNAYTLEAFAAVRLVMMDDARSDGVAYIACQLRPDLDTRVLCKHGIRFGFPRTEALLGMLPGAVRLNRRNPCVVEHLFEYPGYFLDADNLQQVLWRANQAGRIAVDDILDLTGLKPDAVCVPRNLHRLARLLSGPDELGTRLRALIAHEVGDGVYSSVAPTGAYQDRAWSVLTQLGARTR